MTYPGLVGHPAPAAIINGAPRELAGPLPVVDLLAEYGLAVGMVVVEVNGRALLRSEAAAAVVHPGDTVELVRAVAGG